MLALFIQTLNITAPVFAMMFMGVLLRRIAQLSGRTGRDQAGRREMAQGVRRQVTVAQAGRRFGSQPGGYHAVAELARGGSVTEDAGVEVQEFHRCLLE